MPGHNPHRPEGKAPDMEHMRRRSVKDERDAPRATREPPTPNEVPAEEPRGGSRPGVPSRMREPREE
jgi:hypothetical protein